MLPAATETVRTRLEPTGPTPESHLVEDVPLPVIGRGLDLQDCVSLFQRAVFPDTTVHLGEASLPYQITDMEGVLVPSEGESRPQDR